MKCWAMVPARGGSKSIPLKNLVPVCGRPLIDYGVLAARASGAFERIICSTEDERITERCQTLGIEVDRRPESLCGDDTPVSEVAQEFLARTANPPDYLALIQPTSLFLRAEDITNLLAAIRNSPGCNSGQTITAIPHNHHAWNQRVLVDGMVRFNFAEERQKAYNKQSKPKLFVFGNLVVARVEALLQGASFFQEPSAYVEIQSPYDFDLDVSTDIQWAEILLNAGKVILNHLS